MSLCDTCMKPGACCQRLFLTGAGGEAEAPKSFEAAEHFAMRSGLPFRPLYQTEAAWHWWCTALGSDGRCTIYENRPQLCRDFKPGSDPLCVHYWARPESEAA